MCPMVTAASGLTGLTGPGNPTEPLICPCFKNEVGLAPGTGIIRQRLELACHFLQTEEFSISDISGMLPYPDAAAFSKPFKQVLGVSPSACRRTRISKQAVASDRRSTDQSGHETTHTNPPSGIF